MTLSVGAKIGPYQILALIGAGSMGEVYHAGDTKLKRHVALKVLPSAFSSDPDRVRRFEQDGRAAAALNHPNIVVLYDAGLRDGVYYIATELLEGESLHERLFSTALPVRKAIDYSIQIAHGLAAAHAKGIVHRDLKHENLFVTKDGIIKILDFGLAKYQTPKSPATSPTELATETIETEPGKVLGTVGYMSPEQVRGQIADARSDLFSRGVVLFEMVSGKRAFVGDSVVEVMNAILKQEPPELEGAAPPSLDLVIRRCLEKKPEERFQSASDLAFALESTSGTSDRKAQPAPRRRHLRAAALIAGICILVAAGLITALQMARPSSPTFQRVTYATDVDARRAKTSHPEAIAALTSELADFTYFAEQDWFRNTIPLRLPRLAEFLTLGEVERILKSRHVQLIEREYDEKFHLLQAPRLVLPDLAYYREASGVRGNPVGLAFIDIDDFKRLNTKHGHHVIDQVVLPVFMRCLEAFAFARGFAYRNGGDEYVVVLWKWPRCPPVVGRSS